MLRWNPERALISNLLALALLTQPMAWATSPTYDPLGPAPSHRAVRKAKRKHLRKAPAQETSTIPMVEQAPTIPPEGAHTSLIIDARGTTLARGMGPRFYSQSGAVVYGNFASNFEYAQEHGVVEYVADMKEATMLPDAGANPLVVKLASVDTVMSSDGVLDDASAAAISDAAGNWDFLKYQKVIVVTDN